MMNTSSHGPGRGPPWNPYQASNTTGGPPPRASALGLTFNKAEKPKSLDDEESRIQINDRLVRAAARNHEESKRRFTYDYPVPVPRPPSCPPPTASRPATAQAPSFFPPGAQAGQWPYHVPGQAYGTTTDYAGYQANSGAGYPNTRHRRAIASAPLVPDPSWPNPPARRASVQWPPQVPHQASASRDFPPNATVFEPPNFNPQAASYYAPPQYLDLSSTVPRSAPGYNFPGYVVPAGFQWPLAPFVVLPPSFLHQPFRPY
ncbi:hypothetical protein NLJ89_g574 [Agrocybe chaxingu]|uniref:Uncharacterized protein n=1 Tax=Agrocybe chaxingu TaxID=84603 RepID=A0A9W8N1M4_9AGAR|nr:hypothetical protein NLJ89_g574 [Agrocybe chaxingu]